jgi:hypothetical protein
MMRLWMVSYIRPRPVLGATAVSFIAHAVLISSWVASTRPSSSMDTDGLANRVYYLPPPNREVVGRGSREAVRYLALVPGVGSGPGPARIDLKKTIIQPEPTPTAGANVMDSAISRPMITAPDGDSVFTILEVDTEAVRSQNSAGPAYPLDLLSKHVQGSVHARFIVDTTGFADTTSFEVVTSTNDGFVRAVRDALPYMRFTAAKIGTKKVRQLVEQPFTFRIDPAKPTTPSARPDFRPR